MQAPNSGVTRHCYPALTSWWTHCHLFSGRLLWSVPTGLKGHRTLRKNSPKRSLPHESLWHNLHTSVWPRRTGRCKRVDQPGVRHSLQASGQVADPVGLCSLRRKWTLFWLRLPGQAAEPGGAEGSPAQAEVVREGAGGFAAPSR